MTRIILVLCAAALCGCGGGSGGGGGGTTVSPELPVWELQEVQALSSITIGNNLRDRFDVRRDGLLADPRFFDARVGYSGGSSNRRVDYWIDPDGMGLPVGSFGVQFVPPTSGEWERVVEVDFVDPEVDFTGTIPYELQFTVLPQVGGDAFTLNPFGVKLFSEIVVQQKGGKIGLNLGVGSLFSVCPNDDGGRSHAINLFEVPLRVRLVYVDVPANPEQFVEIDRLDREGLFNFNPIELGKVVAIGEFFDLTCLAWVEFTPERVFRVELIHEVEARPVLLLEEYRVGSEIEIGCSLDLRVLGSAVWIVLSSPDGFLITLNLPIGEPGSTFSRFVPHQEGTWKVDLIFIDQLTAHLVFTHKLQHSFTVTN